MPHRDDESDIAVTLPVLGNLSYREIHAFEVGLYSATRYGENAPRAGDDDSYRFGREDHYWKMGFLTGRIGIIVVVYAFLSRLLRA